MNKSRTNWNAYTWSHLEPFNIAAVTRPLVCGNIELLKDHVIVSYQKGLHEWRNTHKFELVNYSTSYEIALRYEVASALNGLFLMIPFGATISGLSTSNSHTYF